MTSILSSCADSLNVLQVGQIPFLDKLITKNPLFLALAPTHPVVKFTVERMKERISARGQGIDDKRRDFLTRCFEAQSKYSDLVTDRIIRMWNIDNVLAGSDTTGISLRSVSIHHAINSWSDYEFADHHQRSSTT